MRTHALLCLLAASALALVGCEDNPTSALTDGSQVPSDATAAAPTAKTSVVPDLGPNPESAVYDPVADAYYVGNLGANVGAGAISHLIDVDGNGFISKIQLDGSGNPGTVTKSWIGSNDLDVTLDGATGMYLVGRDLYVVDRDEILVYTLGSTAPFAPTSATSIPLPGPGVAVAGGAGLDLPNDIVLDGSGNIWLSDTGLDLNVARTFNDAVYEYDGSSWTRVIGGSAGASDYGCPNGVAAHGGSAYFLTFCSNEVLRIDGTNQTTEVASVPRGPGGVGRLDGLVILADGTMYFSDWWLPGSGKGKVYRASLDRPGPGGATVAARLGAPADITFDGDHDRVLIPSAFDLVLKIVQVKG